MMTEKRRARASQQAIGVARPPPQRQLAQPPAAKDDEMAEAKRRARGGPAIAVARTRPAVAPSAAPNKDTEEEMAQAKRRARGGPAVAVARTRPAVAAATATEHKKAATFSKDEEEMAEAKRRARGGPAVAVARTRPTVASSTTAETPKAAAPSKEDEEMAQAKRRARGGPAVAVARTRPAVASSTTAETPKGAPSKEDEEMAQAKRRARGGPAVAVARNPPRAAAVPTPDGSPRKSTDDEIKRREKERAGPAMAVARTPARGSTNSSNLDNNNSMEEIKRREKERAGPAVAAPRSSTSNLEELDEIKRREKEGNSGPSVARARAAAPDPSSATTTNGTTNQSNSNVDDIFAAKSREVESKNNATMVPRSRNHSRTARNNDDEEDSFSSSTGSAYALAMARSSMAKEATKLKAMESGPSLAPATPGEVLPGAFTVMDREMADKEKAAAVGPSLAPAVSQDVSRLSSFDEVHEEDEFDNVDIEAQAGVPVAFPGAFAVQGVDTPDTASDYSSTEDQDDSAVDDYMESGILDGVVGQEAPSALEAEVYEEVIVEGNILIETDEDEIDPKAVRRLRMIQGTVVCFCMAAIGLVVGSVLGFSSVGDQGPTVEGWVQVGGDIYGPIEDPQTIFGSSLALSADGKHLAVAAPGYDEETKLNVGQIRIFREEIDSNGTNWEPVYNFNGNLGPSEEAQMSIAMSKDAAWLAVGYPRLTQGSQVQLYGYSGVEKNWLPSVPISNLQNDTAAWFGYALDLSADGTVLAVGAPLAEGSFGIASGSVQVFQRDESGGGWSPRGEVLDGGAPSEFFGWSVALAADGTRLAVGAPVAGDTTGLARTYEWTGGTWEQLGSDLVGIIPLNRFGESTALSDDGKVLAIGARGSAFETGETKIYREVDGAWFADGNTIPGQEAGEGFGSSVALSGDGNTLAVGAPQNNIFGEASGLIQVFKYDSATSTWEQEGGGIGSQIVSEFGAAVALSNDGMRVAGGAPMTAYDGTISRAGSALVFDREVPQE